MNDTTPFNETLARARRLPRTERARLIARLAEELAADTPVAEYVSDPLPVITEGTWSDTLPGRREELYDDTGRA